MIMQAVKRPIRVIIAEDHDLTRLSLKKELNGLDGLEVIGTGRNGEEAVRLSAAVFPDVILMDIMMPVLDGIAASYSVKSSQPETKIVMLTSRADLLLDSMEIGIDAYCLKTMSVTHIYQVIQTVNDKVMWLEEEA